LTSNTDQYAPDDPKKNMAEYCGPDPKGKVVLAAGIACLICTASAIGPAAAFAGYTESALANGFLLSLGCLFLLGCILGPIIWRTGSRLLTEIDSTQTHLQERKLIVAGRRCGIVATLLSPIAAIGLVAAFIRAAFSFTM
jgi:hypothetical protein